MMQDNLFAHHYIVEVLEPVTDLVLETFMAVDYSHGNDLIDEMLETKGLDDFSYMLTRIKNDNTNKKD